MENVLISMPELMKRNPHWVAIIGIIVSMFLTVVGASVAYGGVNRQVVVNKEDIKVIDERVGSMPTTREFDSFKEQINSRFDTIESLLKN